MGIQFNSTLGSQNQTIERGEEQSDLLCVSFNMRIEVSEAMCQGSCVGVELFADHWRNGLKWGVDPQQRPHCQCGMRELR